MSSDIRRPAIFVELRIRDAIAIVLHAKTASGPPHVNHAERDSRAATRTLCTIIADFEINNNSTCNNGNSD
jgi:hypothetical protein